MNLVTDIHEIEDLAMLNQDENWQFRVFMKGYDTPSKRLDAMVSNLTRGISAKIDCTICGNCCIKLEPVLVPSDVKRFSKSLKIAEKEFHDTYLTCDPEGDVIFKQKPCPFYENNRCTHYAFRPDVCRSYPHLDNSEFVFRLIKVVQNTSICPIVFNVYEGLKEKLRTPFLEFRDDFLEEDFW